MPWVRSQAFFSGKTTFFKDRNRSLKSRFISKTWAINGLLSSQTQTHEEMIYATDSCSDRIGCSRGAVMGD
jgi:hypothetical protein